MTIETITLGGGCFWCLEAAFQTIRGVQSVTSGYSGGARPDPTYQQVCSGATGHAEVVQIAFDADEMDLATLLHVFFAVHDPTTPNRQGADVGTQYRSVIFFHSDTQRETAERVIAELTEEGLWSSPIVTQIEPLSRFYPAESYHQDYYRQHPGQGYCQAVISPKLAKLRAGYAELLRA
jgi:peptide-methionine (S)-S-oxide reductase